MTDSRPAAPAAAPLEAAVPRTIIGWEAGSPVYADAVRPDAATATPAPAGTSWLLKPGDLVCDWCGVEAADSRGLLRLFINLTIYAKLAGLIAFALS